MSEIVNKIFGNSDKEREMDNKLIESADFKLALQVANDGRASKEVIEKKFCVELWDRIQELEKPCTNCDDASGKNEIIWGIEDIIGMMSKYDICPYHQVDRIVKYLVEYGINVNWRLMSCFISKEKKDKIVKVFLARGLYERAKSAKEKDLSIEEKEELLKRIKEKNFEKPKKLYSPKK